VKSGFKIEKASHGGVDTKTRSDKEIAVDAGRIALGDFGKREGYQLMTKRAPVPRQQLWQKHDIVPRAIDREGVEAFRRSTTGVDQDHKTLIMHGFRISLADKWVAPCRPLI
jgi:carbon-monoxide dehydrogenase catalytic subunit